MRCSLKMCILVIASLAPAYCQAQQWATKMFIDGRDHDFGTVARGADVVYKFPVKNLYRQDIELTGVRSSCGCTTPSLDKKVLKTHEIGHVIAKFNTRTFKGVHGATLTVSMKWTGDNGRTHTGEAQLRVHGDIRSDVVVQPGSVRFGKVDQGSAAEQRIQVAYAGRNSWKINNVLSRSDDLEVELLERKRQAGRVEYELLIRLKDSAGAGNLKEQLVLVTNDSNNERIPLDVEADILSEISVAPASLSLGEVQQGEEISRKFLVRGKKPFRIVGIDCEDDCFSFQVPQEAAQRHFVELKFAPSNESGRVERAIDITTDLGDKYKAQCLVFATVLPTAEQTSGTASNDSAASSVNADQTVRN